MVLWRALIIVWFALITTAAYALPTISLKELIAEANSFNNIEVVVSGEVIGDILNRGEFSWVNIQQNDSQIGLWVPNALIKAIQFKGDYSHQGDVIEVSGVFMRADPKLAGDMRVKVDQITVIRPGHRIEHAVSREKVETAVFLLIMLIALISVGTLFKKARQRS